MMTAAAQSQSGPRDRSTGGGGRTRHNPICYRNPIRERSPVMCNDYTGKLGEGHGLRSRERLALPMSSADRVLA